jgi:putative transposase
VYGFDGGKLVKGRKRHLLVDTQGLLLGVVVTEANTQDRLGGVAVLMEEACESGGLQLLWADQGYSGERFARAICASQQRFAIAFVCGAKVEVVKRTEAGFQVLPRRWVVERTLGWLGRYRRLSKDYELLPEVSESMIYAAMVRLMLGRLAS